MSERPKRSRFTKEFKVDAIRLVLDETMPTAQFYQELESYLRIIELNQCALPIHFELAVTPTRLFPNSSITFISGRPSEPDKFANFSTR